MSENVVYPFLPNGFADHYPSLSLFFMAISLGIYPTFSDKPICWDGIIWDPWGLAETSNTQRFGYLWKFGRSPKIYPSPKEFMSLCNNMGYPVAGLLAATKTPWILRGFFRVLWRLGQDFHAKHLWSVKSVSSYSPCSPK